MTEYRGKNFRKWERKKERKKGEGKGEEKRGKRKEKDSKGKERQCCLLAPWDKFSEKVQKLNTEIIHKIKKYRQHHLSRKKKNDRRRKTDKANSQRR